MFNITEKLHETARALLSRFDIVAFPNDAEKGDNVPREATVGEVANVIKEHLPFWGGRPFECGLLFGVIPVSIPGYTIITQEKDWLLAEAADGQRYFVVRTPGGWLLHPQRTNEDFRSELNPPGVFCEYREAIYIPR